MMTIKKMMNESFETFTLSDWEQKAEEALKGNVVSSLYTNTYENIKLKPLYTRNDVENEEVYQYPSQADYRRGYSSLGYLSQEWKVAQKIEAGEGESLKENLISAIDKGQSAIAFDVGQVNVDDLLHYVEDLYNVYPFCLEANENQADILGNLAKLPNCNQVTGYIAADPLAQLALKGTGAEKEVYDRFANAIQLADSKLPKLRTILVDSSVYHNAGANAVQELAFALATVVHHVQQLLERGLTLETTFSKMVFKFSIGASFFMEIAKLRAAKILWNKVLEAYGVNSKEYDLVISAETSSFTKTVFDPYVNLLRAGNEAFAAVLGGIQYLNVSPFNEPEGHSTPFSDRIARNTQLILKNEAHLEKIADPAGGSWYIESLTNELAEKAWSLFLEIDDKDGIKENLKSGWIGAQINEVLHKRSQDILTRKTSIIGTNVYANLKDSPLQFFESANDKLGGIQQVRLSEPFEKLRKQAITMEEAGNKPITGLICLGELKSYKARMDFITGFLAPGGIHTEKSGNIVSPEMAVYFINGTNLKHYVICGSDSQYEKSALEIIRLVKETQPNVELYLAGLPNGEKQEQYKQAGITQFIHLRSNCLEILSSLLSEMEVATDDE